MVVSHLGHTVEGLVLCLQKGGKLQEILLFKVGHNMSEMLFSKPQCVSDPFYLTPCSTGSSIWFRFGNVMMGTIICDSPQIRQCVSLFVCLLVSAFPVEPVDLLLRQDIGEKD